MTFSPTTISRMTLYLWSWSELLYCLITATLRFIPQNVAPLNFILLVVILTIGILLKVIILNEKAFTIILTNVIVLLIGVLNIQMCMFLLNVILPNVCLLNVFCQMLL